MHKHAFAGQNTQHTRISPIILFLCFVKDFILYLARKYAVLCHENLERMLQKQHNTLQQTLEELRLYKKQHDTW